MKALWTLFLLISGLLMSSCGDSDSDQALCDCVHTNADGSWDMQLSEECMQRCVEEFGPSLKGMEAWFEENCGIQFQHPHMEDPSVQQI
ncbi:MAG: hypothetical protein AAF804_00815 [Bacteroidota bacterium]